MIQSRTEPFIETNHFTLDRGMNTTSPAPLQLAVLPALPGACVLLDNILLKIVWQTPQDRFVITGFNYSLLFVICNFISGFGFHVNSFTTTLECLIIQLFLLSATSVVNPIQSNLILAVGLLLLLNQKKKKGGGGEIKYINWKKIKPKYFSA